MELRSTLAVFTVGLVVRPTVGSVFRLWTKLPSNWAIEVRPGVV
ncbi:hypothetical protein GFS60_02736 [Rhodococcus sp. WAY2]|nr:hypothetical protein GFS60_02736 [Rhodococcus sp. WAY2]